MAKHLRQDILNLMKEKDRLEGEIKELNAVLKKNGVGVNEPLVDSEGFPLNNIDIYQVRHARHLLICKQNDHKALMKLIERGLQDYYGPGTVNNVPMVTESREVEDVPGPRLLRVHKVPFAKISSVIHGSPADIANLKVNDQLVQFGSINSLNYRGLTDVGTVVFHSEGMEIDVKIKRGDTYITLILVPKKWSGSGLLGCNVVPLDD